MRLHVRGHRIRNSGKAPEKLCPLCRQEQGDHARLVRHIVDDHGQRLECTEYVQILHTDLFSFLKQNHATMQRFYQQILATLT